MTTKKRLAGSVAIISTMEHRARMWEKRPGPSCNLNWCGEWMLIDINFVCIIIVSNGLLKGVAMIFG